jgi:hypothetical protein
MFKIFKNTEACKRHEKNYDELLNILFHKFPGGKYNKSQSNFDRIEKLCNDLIKKQKTYILYNELNPVVVQIINITLMSVQLILKPC